MATSIPDYETVAKSQTAQVLGLIGAQGDYIERLIIVPETTSPGLVSLLDNATTLAIMVAGTTTIAPITVELGLYSKTGAWKITTGDNVHVIAIGTFTHSATV